MSSRHRVRGVMAAAAVAVLAVGCAGPTQDAVTAQARQCFHVTAVDHYNARGGHGLVIKRKHGGYYQAEFFAYCPEADEGFQIRMRNINGGNFLCPGEDVRVTAFSPVSRPGDCLARNLRLMTPQEVAGLAPKDRP